MDIFITFDNYYDVNTYNSFIQASKNNNIYISEYINIKPPYNRHIKLNSKTDLPKFINYDFSTKSEIRWLVSVIKPVDTRESFLLKRIPGEDNIINKFIRPNPFKRKIDYIIFFKNIDFSEMRLISKQLGKVKIYLLTKGKFKIWYCFNPMIKQFIPTNERYLLEFGKESENSPARFSSLKVPESYSKIEYYLNSNVLIKEKVENKYREASFWFNGIYNPIKNKTFL